VGETLMDGGDFRSMISVDETITVGPTFLNALSCCIYLKMDLKVLEYDTVLL